MNYFSEQDIRDIVADVLAQSGIGRQRAARKTEGLEVPVEISAKHVHLTKEAVETLFGAGHNLTPKRDLSQPGQFLSEERVKLVTTKGELSNVAILGPVRPAIQVELSLTDARNLGIKAPICLSGDLEGAADVVIVGPEGVVTAREAAIISKAHVHMTPADARHYGVRDGESVDIRLTTERPVTLNDVLVRVRDDSALAVHIDFDEANAAQLAGATVGLLLKKE